MRSFAPTIPPHPTLMPLEAADLLTCLHVVENTVPERCRVRERPPIRSEGRAAPPPTKPGDREQLIPGVGIPESHGLVAGRRQQGPTVRRKIDGAHGLRMPHLHDEDLRRQLRLARRHISDQEREAYRDAQEPRAPSPL